MIVFRPAEPAGLLPSFFTEDDPRQASHQLDEAYAHGGGFQPHNGPWSLHLAEHVGHAFLRYPGDPPFKEVSRATLHHETLILCEAAFLAIVQPSGEFVVCRVD